MNKFVKLLLLVVMLLGGGVVAAQEGTSVPGGVTLSPFTDDTFGIMGVIPDGWIKAAPGVYARNSATGDTTVIAQQAAVANLDALVASLLPQLGLTELPESSGNYETDAFTWALYTVEVDAGTTTVVVDLALTHEAGKSYLVLLQTSPEEHDALRESVFLPVLDALQPTVFALEDDLAYYAENVTFDNGDITLAGTLSLPDGDGPHPAVVLVSGSGPQDRNETLLPTAEIQPFKLLADYLTQRGIAVLRYDDRGVGESSGDFGAADVYDFTTDAAAAIDYLMTRDEIDPEQIGIVGHSEGGMVASMLGATNPNVAFIVGLAAPGVNGRDLLMVQNRRLILAEGGTQEQVDDQIAFLERLFDLLESGDTDGIGMLIREQATTQIDALPQEQKDAIGDIDAYIDQVVEQQTASLGSDWMRSVLTYDAAADWEQTTVPVLAVFGGNDVQVDAEQNAPALEAALEAAGNTDYQIVVLPTANHLFQDATTGAVSEYISLPAEFVDGLLTTIGDWILDHVTLYE